MDLDFKGEGRGGTPEESFPYDVATARFTLEPEPEDEDEEEYEEEYEE